MKKLLILLLLFCTFGPFYSQGNDLDKGQSGYIPSEENLRNRECDPAEWGVAVEKGDYIYLHVTNPLKVNNELVLNNFPYKLKKVSSFETGTSMKFKIDKKTSSVILQIPEFEMNAIDNVIVIKVSK